MNENNFTKSALTQRRPFERGHIRKFKHALI